MNTRTITRRASTAKMIDYFGAKHTNWKFITQHFAPHECYIEPFCGSCAVLINKPKSTIETVNDLDGRLINFLKMVRDRPQELYNALSLTPWSRDEFRLCLVDDGDDLERARRFFVACNQAVSPGGKSWSVITQTRLGQSTAIDRIGATHVLIERLLFVAKRICKVQIESKDYTNIMERFDHKYALFYCDPPYVSSTRTSTKKYNHDFTEQDHRILAELARTRQGFVVISGYNCDLYEELYQGWERVTRKSTVNSGSVREESLWLCPRTSEWLHSERQLEFL